MSEDDFSEEAVKKRLQAEKDAKGPNPNYKETPSLEQREAEKKREAVLNLVGDVKRQGEDIDRLNQSMTYVAEQMQKIAATVDKQTEAINMMLKGGAVAPEPGKGGIDMNQIGAVGDLIDKLATVYKTVKGEPQGAPPLISNEQIQQKMVKAFNDDLETGESIRKFISDSLKRKATKDIVNSSLSNIGGPDFHGPA